MTHAELSHEHYHLIRTDPSYRNFLLLEEIKLEQEPSWATEVELLEEVAPVIKGIAELSNKEQIERLKELIDELSDNFKVKGKEKYTIK